MKRSFYFYPILTLLLFLWCSTANAQKTISGTVTDRQGPLPGVTVFQTGSESNGTVTDMTGHYSISVPEGSVLKFSFIGYREQLVTVGAQTVCDIVLHEDATLIDEVVITGYGGAQRRAKLTNSIAKPDAKALRTGSFTNPAAALTGAVSGLRVVSSSGNPNAVPTITLRGGTNFDGTSNAPLVIVDGQLRDSMEDISPDNIESLEILKDAGATAIYGARASNGVILITTKKGKEGSREITFKSKVGLDFFSLPWEFCNARDYIYWMRKAYAGSHWANAATLNGVNAYGTGATQIQPSSQYNILRKTDDNAYLLDLGWQEMTDPIDGTTAILFKDTDVSDYNINTPAVTQDYYTSMSGGNTDGSYYAGLGYNNSDGMARTTYYNRLSFIFNGSYRINGWLTSKSGVDMSRSKYRSLTATQGSESNYFGRIMSAPPTSRFEDEDGNMLLGLSTGDGNQNYQNDKFYRDNENLKATFSQSFTATAAKCLTFSLNGSWYFDMDLNESFNRDFQTNQAGTKFNRTRSSSSSFQRYFAQTYNAALNYTGEFAGGHSLDLMAGSEYYERTYRYLYAAGQEAPTDDFADLGLTSAQEGKRTIDTTHSTYRILSFFGRLNYDYLGRYLLSATFREDGYSALLDNRWGFFPGISAGWIFSDEPFFGKAAQVMSFGKLRVSYGINGNASGIGAYDLQGAYSSITYNGRTGFSLTTLPNSGLRWEKTSTFDAGLDMGFFDNRLNVNLTFYNRLTDNKYANLSIPSTTGFTSMKSNSGKFRNRGLELELSGRILSVGDFQWDAAANITYNRNLIVSLPYNGLPGNRQGGTEVYTGNGNETVWVGGWQEGQEPGCIVGYVSEGLFRSESDFPEGYIVKSGHYTGKYQYSPAEWAKLTPEEQANGILLAPGDQKWKDMNGDGIIDAKDQTVLGNTTPHWTGGLNTTLQWKGLSLHTVLDYAFGFKTGQNPANSFTWYMGCMQGAFNMPTDVWDTYTPENTGATYPRYVWADQLGPSNYYRVNSMFIYDGAYIGLNRVCLAYRLPARWTGKAGLGKVEFSVTGQNLGYLTKAMVINPTIGGLVQSSYPLPRTLLFGADITF